MKFYKLTPEKLDENSYKGFSISKIAGRLETADNQEFSLRIKEHIDSVRNEVSLSAEASKQIPDVVNKIIRNLLDISKTSIVAFFRKNTSSTWQDLYKHYYKNELKRPESKLEELVNKYLTSGLRYDIVDSAYENAVLEVVDYIDSLTEGYFTEDREVKLSIHTGALYIDNKAVSSKNLNEKLDSISNHTKEVYLDKVAQNIFNTYGNVYDFSYNKIREALSAEDDSGADIRQILNHKKVEKVLNKVIERREKGLMNRAEFLKLKENTFRKVEEIIAIADKYINGNRVKKSELRKAQSFLDKFSKLKGEHKRQLSQIMSGGNIDALQNILSSIQEDDREQVRNQLIEYKLGFVYSGIRENRFGEMTKQSVISVEEKVYKTLNIFDEEGYADKRYIKNLQGLIKSVENVLNSAVDELIRKRFIGYHEVLRKIDKALSSNAEKIYINKSDINEASSSVDKAFEQKISRVVENSWNTYAREITYQAMAAAVLDNDENILSKVAGELDKQERYNQVLSEAKNLRRVTDIENELSNMDLSREEKMALETINQAEKYILERNLLNIDYITEEILDGRLQGLVTSMLKGQTELSNAISKIEELSKGAQTEMYLSKRAEDLRTKLAEIKKYTNLIYKNVAPILSVLGVLEFMYDSKSTSVTREGQTYAKLLIKNLLTENGDIRSAIKSLYATEQLAERDIEKTKAMAPLLLMFLFSGAVKGGEIGDTDSKNTSYSILDFYGGDMTGIYTDGDIDSSKLQEILTSLGVKLTSVQTEALLFSIKSRGINYLEEYILSGLDVLPGLEENLYNNDKYTFSVGMQERQSLFLRRGMMAVGSDPAEFLDRYTRGWSKDKKDSYYKELSENSFLSGMFKDTENGIEFKGRKGRLTVSQYLEMFKRFTGIGVSEVLAYIDKGDFSDWPDDYVDFEEAKLALGKNDRESYHIIARIITHLRQKEVVDRTLPRINLSFEKQGIYSFNDLKEKYPDLYSFLRDFILMQNLMRGDSYWVYNGGISSESSPQRMKFIENAVEWFKNKALMLYDGYYSKVLNISRASFELALSRLKTVDIWKETEQKIKQEGKKPDLYRISAEIFTRFMIGVMVEVNIIDVLEDDFKIEPSKLIPYTYKPVEEKRPSVLYETSVEAGLPVDNLVDPDLYGDEAKEILSRIKFPLSDFEPPIAEIEALLKELSGDIKDEYYKTLTDMKEEFLLYQEKSLADFKNKYKQYLENIKGILDIVPDDLKSEIAEKIQQSSSEIEQEIAKDLKNKTFNPDKYSDLVLGMIDDVQRSILQYGKEKIDEYAQDKYDEANRYYYEWLRLSDELAQNIGNILSDYDKEFPGFWDKWSDRLDKMTELPLDRVSSLKQSMIEYRNLFKENAIFGISQFVDKVKRDFEAVTDIGFIEMKTPTTLFVLEMNDEIRNILGFTDLDPWVTMSDGRRMVSLSSAIERYRELKSKGVDLPPFEQMFSSLFVAYSTTGKHWENHSSDVYPIKYDLDSDTWTIEYGGIYTYRTGEYDSNPVKGILSFKTPKSEDIGDGRRRFTIPEFSLVWENAGEEGDETVKINFGGLVLEGTDENKFSWDKVSASHRTLLYDGKEINHQWVKEFLSTAFEGLDTAQLDYMNIELPSGFIFGISKVFYDNNTGELKFDTAKSYLPSAQGEGGTLFNFEKFQYTKEKTSLESGDIIADYFTANIKLFLKGRDEISVKEFKFALKNWGDAFLRGLSVKYGENSVEYKLAKARIDSYVDNISVYISGLEGRDKDGTSLDVSRIVAVSGDIFSYIENMKFNYKNTDKFSLEMGLILFDVIEGTNNDNSAKVLSEFLNNNKENYKSLDERVEMAMGQILPENNLYAIASKAGLSVSDESFMAYINNAFISYRKQLFTNIKEILAEKDVVSDDEIRYILKITSETFLSTEGAYIYNIVERMNASFDTNSSFSLDLSRFYLKKVSNSVFNLENKTPQDIVDNMLEISGELEAELNNLSVYIEKTGDLSAQFAYLRLKNYKNIIDSYIKDFYAGKSGSSVVLNTDEAFLKYKEKASTVLSELTNLHFKTNYTIADDGKIDILNAEGGLSEFFILNQMNEVKNGYKKLLSETISKILSSDMSDEKKFEALQKEISENTGIYLKDLGMKYDKINNGNFVLNLAKLNVLNWKESLLTSLDTFKLEADKDSFSVSANMLNIFMKNKDLFTIKGVSLDVDIANKELSLEIVEAGYSSPEKSFVTLLKAMNLKYSKEKGLKIGFEQYSAELEKQVKILANKFGLMSEDGDIQEAFLNSLEIYAMYKEYLFNLRQSMYMDKDGNINLESLTVALDKLDNALKGGFDDIDDESADSLFSGILEGYEKTKESVKFDRLGYQLGELARMALSKYEYIDNSDVTSLTYDYEMEIANILNAFLKGYYQRVYKTAESNGDESEVLQSEKGFNALKVGLFNDFITAVAEKFKEEVVKITKDGKEGLVTTQTLDRLAINIGEYVTAEMKTMKKVINELENTTTWTAEKIEAFLGNLGNADIKDFYRKEFGDGKVAMSASEFALKMVDAVKIIFHDAFSEEKEDNYLKVGANEAVIEFLKFSLLTTINNVLYEKYKGVDGDTIVEVSADLVKTIYKNWEANIVNSYAEFINGNLASSVMQTMVTNGKIKVDALAVYLNEKAVSDTGKERFDLAFSVDKGWLAFRSNLSYEYITDKDGKEQIVISIDSYDTDLDNTKQEIISFVVPEGEKISIERVKQIAQSSSNIEDFAFNLNKELGEDRDVSLNISTGMLHEIISINKEFTPEDEKYFEYAYILASNGVSDETVGNRSVINSILKDSGISQSELNKISYEKLENSFNSVDDYLEYRRYKFLHGILKSLSVMVDRGELYQTAKLSLDDIKSFGDIINRFNKGETGPREIVDFALKHLAGTSTKKISQDALDYLTQIIVSNMMDGDGEVVESGSTKLKGGYRRNVTDYYASGSFTQTQGVFAEVERSSGNIVRVSMTSGEFVAGLSPTGSDVLDPENSPLNAVLNIKGLAQLAVGKKFDIEFTDGAKMEIRAMGGVNYIELGSAVLQMALTGEDGSREESIRIPVIASFKDGTTSKQYVFPNFAVSFNQTVQKGDIKLDIGATIGNGLDIREGKGGQLSVGGKSIYSFMAGLDWNGLGLNVGQNIDESKVVGVGVGSDKLKAGVFLRAFSGGDKAFGFNLNGEVSGLNLNLQFLRQGGNKSVTLKAGKTF